MKFQKINIATAQIKGLNDSPYQWSDSCCCLWDITFSDSSYSELRSSISIKVGDDKEKGEICCNKLKENFYEARIYDGDKVAVIFGDNGDVLAIGNIGEDVWIDTTDKFVTKTFSELNIVITGLKVY